jgi:hypothetical protein
MGRQNRLGMKVMIYPVDAWEKQTVANFSYRHDAPVQDSVLRVASLAAALRRGIAFAASSGERKQGRGRQSLIRIEGFH